MKSKITRIGKANAKTGYILVNIGPDIMTVPANVADKVAGLDEVMCEGDWVKVDEIPDRLDQLTIVGGQLARASDELLARRRRLLEVAVLSAEAEELHRLLSKSDYKATKFGEGIVPEEEYAPIRAQRSAWRARINEIETILAKTEPEPSHVPESDDPVPETIPAGE